MAREDELDRKTEDESSAWTPRPRLNFPEIYRPERKSHLEFNRPTIAESRRNELIRRELRKKRASKPDRGHIRNPKKTNLRKPILARARGRAPGRAQRRSNARSVARSPDGEGGPAGPSDDPPPSRRSGSDPSQTLGSASCSSLPPLRRSSPSPSPLLPQPVPGSSFANAIPMFSRCGGLGAAAVAVWRCRRSGPYLPTRVLWFVVFFSF